MRNLFLFIAILFFSSLASAGFLQMQEQIIMSKMCEVAKDAETGTSDGADDFPTEAANQTYATQFTTTSAYTVCRIGLFFATTGSPTMNFTVGIYTNNTDEPGTLIGDLSTPRNAASFLAAESEKIFIGFSAPLLTTTLYWIVVFTDGYDAANYISWHLESGAVTERVGVNTSPPTAWNTWAGYSLKYQLYSE